jgi:hypothetical protein
VEVLEATGSQVFSEQLLNFNANIGNGLTDWGSFVHCRII